MITPLILLLAGAVHAQEPDLIVDPFTGRAYTREELAPPRPKPVPYTIDADGRKHYLYDSDREVALKELSSRIHAEGAITAARYEMERILRDMLAKSPVSLLQRLAMSDVQFVVVPSGSRVTETDLGSRMNIAPAPDGRTAEDARGVTARSRRFGGWVVFVPESNLLERKGDPAGRDGMPRETVVHEIAHAVHDVGTDDPFDERWGSDRAIVVEQDYRQARSGDAKFTDGYARTNSGEYFAQASVAWFGLHRDGRDAAWIKDHQPDLYRTLEAVFGPPRNLGPLR